MRYGEVISRAFRNLRSRPMWGFGFAGALMLGPAVLLMIGSFALLFVQISRASSSSPTSAAAVVWGAAYVLAGILGGLAWVAYSTGLVHVSEETFWRRPVRTADGFRVARRLYGRAICFFLLVGSMWIALWIVCFLLLFGSAAASSGSSGGSPLMCCALPLFYALLLVGVWTIWVVSEIGLRGIVIGHLRSGKAFTRAWRMIRRRFKQMFVMSLLIGLLQYGYQSVVSAVTVLPIYAVALSSVLSADPRALASSGPPPAILLWFVAIYPLMAIAYIPWVIFSASAWTSAYHEIVDGPGAVGPTASPEPEPPAIPFLPPPPPALDQKPEAVTPAPPVTSAAAPPSEEARAQSSPPSTTDEGV